MVCNVPCITVWPISVSSLKFIDEIRKKLKWKLKWKCVSLKRNRNFFFSHTVIEVANGDYGEFVPQLAISANRSMSYQADNPADYDDDDQNTPVIKIDTLGCPDMPLLKKQQSMDCKDIIRSPSEWSKFWTLVGRSQVYYYRDWVRNPEKRRFFFSSFLYVSHCDIVFYE